MPAPPYAESTRLRALIAALDAEVARLPRHIATDDGKIGTRSLRAAWTELVGFLAVAPAPDLRQCPYCGNAVMREATRCRDCWKRLTPPDVRASLAQA
jgi:hypothetical protein